MWIKIIINLFVVYVTVLNAKPYSNNIKKNATKEIVQGYEQILNQTMLPTADPCDNFYEYVCKAKPELRYSTFDSIRKVIESDLVALFSRKLDKEYKTEFEVERKAKLIFDSCNDMSRKNNEGLLVQQKVLRSLGILPNGDEEWNPDNFNYFDTAANLALYGIGALVSFNTIPHPKNPGCYVLLIEPTKLTNFIDENEPKHSLNNIFGWHINNALSTYKMNSSVTLDVLKFERQLSKLRFAPRKLGKRHYSEITYKELKKRVPGLDWDRYMTRVFGAPLNNRNQLVLSNEQYFRDILDLISITDKKVLAKFLLSKFAKSYHQIVNGTGTRCLQQLKALMPDVVGAIFIRDHVTTNRQREMFEMFHDLKTTFLDVIKKTDWLDDKTRGGILKKISAISPIVGYYNNVTTLEQLETAYQDLDVDSTDFFKNVKNFMKHLFRETFTNLQEQNRAQLKENFDPTEVNAGYLEGENRIIIRAGLIHKYVYHPEYPKAINLAGLGSFIGHEFGHPVDPVCKIFDPKGFIRNWWTNKSTDAYNERVDCLVEQYENLLQFTGVEDAGFGTLQENFADNIGLRISFNLYKNWLERNKDNEIIMENEKLPNFNFTAVQLFFVGFAKFHCKNNEGNAANYIQYTHYSPREYRVIGTLQNMEEFSDAFNCPVGSRMNPERKCRVF